MDRSLFEKIAEPIVTHHKMLSTKKLIQHGNVSVFAHSLAVAAYSEKLAIKLGIDYDRKSLIRGALLHDFFLYDWHETNNVGDGLHGFAHPNTASKNALRYFRLNNKELDIIRKHMWPLTLTKIPRYKESWLVCIADKYCSLLETFRLNTYNDDTFIKHISDERHRKMRETYERLKAERAERHNSENSDDAEQ